MKHIAVILFLMICCDYVAAQESHYHRSLRSQDTEYGLTQEPHFNGSGMLWSRTRNVDDVAITQEIYEDSIARVRAFTELCQKAYDAYEEKDYYHTIVYGDSALTKRFHTPDLYYFMGVSFEHYSDYKNAEWAYKMAMKSGYTKVPGYYPDFMARMKQRKAAEKLQKVEDKRKAKAEKQRQKEEKQKAKEERKSH